MIQNVVQEIENTIQQFIDNVHTAMPGSIESFDPAKCTATVGIHGFFKKPDGEQIEYPPVANVPLRFFQSNGQETTFATPIKEGDGCTVFFAEQSLEAWKAGGEQNLDLKHDLTNAFAVVGLFREPNEIVTEACNDDAAILKHKGVKIKITDGKIHVTGADVRIEGNVDIIGDVFVDGGIAATGDITADGSIIDTEGNTNHHVH